MGEKAAKPEVAKPKEFSTKTKLICLLVAFGLGASLCGWCALSGGRVYIPEGAIDEDDVNQTASAYQLAFEAQRQFLIGAAERFYLGGQANLTDNTFSSASN